VGPRSRAKPVPTFPDRGLPAEQRHRLLDRHRVDLRAGDAGVTAVFATAPRSIRAAVSHCILNEVAYERLKTGLIDELITTNSTPVNAQGLPVRVLSVASLLGKAIQRINSNESVTGLFPVKGF